MSTPVGQAVASIGYVDAHVHIRNTSRLDAVLAAGVSSLRDAGAREGLGFRIDLSNAQTSIPIIISAGQALYKKGGYGYLLGVPVETPGDIKQEITRLKKAGAAIIKVIASGLVSLAESDRITPGGLSREELFVAVQEAAGCGLEVMAHANGADAIMAAVEAGVRSVEHGFYMDTGAIEKMASKGIFWTPTVGALVRAARAAAITRKTDAFIGRLVQRHLVMIEKAFRAGVPLAIGTDCMLPHEEYAAMYREELAYFEQAGIPRKEVEQIARVNGARLLGSGTEGYVTSSK